MPTQKSQLTYDDIVATLPSLDLEEQINLLEILSSVLKKTVTIQKTHRLIELEGLGAEIWTRMDVEAYIRSERDSWN